MMMQREPKRKEAACDHAFRRHAGTRRRASMRGSARTLPTRDLRAARATRGAKTPAEFRSPSCAAPGPILATDRPKHGEATICAHRAGT